MRSDLATLVETEARLDAALSDARARGDAMREAARTAAAAAAASLDAELVAERDRLAAEIAQATRERIVAIEQAAVVDVARYDALTGIALDELAERLAQRLVAIVHEEAT
ncbi:MAG TPA: hypothetical protein VFQ53_18170 [Kofleriaceae bacterium]|nr:hypothetical protein [Kofleriaceae bacterium]